LRWARYSDTVSEAGKAPPATGKQVGRRQVPVTGTIRGPATMRNGWRPIKDSTGRDDHSWVEKNEPDPERLFGPAAHRVAALERGRRRTRVRESAGHGVAPSRSPMRPRCGPDAAQSATYPAHHPRAVLHIAVGCRGSFADHCSVLRRPGRAHRHGDLSVRPAGEPVPGPISRITTSVVPACRKVKQT
jgi:hypothetical protein